MRYRGQNNFTYTTLQNEANRSHEKQNAGSARRVTRIAGSPFCDGTLTFLARPIFLHINTFVHSAVSTRSRGDIRACANTAVSSWLEKWAQLFSHISARLSWLGQEGEPIPRTTFLHVKRGLYTRHLHFTRRKSRNCWWFLKTGGQGSGGPKIGTFFSENTVTLRKDKII